MAEELNWVKVEGTNIFIALEQTQDEYLKRYVAWIKTREDGIPENLGRYSSRHEAQENIYIAVEFAICKSFTPSITKTIYDL